MASAAVSCGYHRHVPRYLIDERWLCGTLCGVNLGLSGASENSRREPSEPVFSPATRGPRSRPGDWGVLEWCRKQDDLRLSEWLGGKNWRIRVKQAEVVGRGAATEQTERRKESLMAPVGGPMNLGSETPSIYGMPVGAEPSFRDQHGAQGSE